MIETVLLNYLIEKLDVPVYMEAPEHKPGTYVLIEKTGSRRRNRIDTATVAIQSIAPTLYGAAFLNESVKGALALLPDEERDVFRAEPDSDYNFTDTETKERRYQAVYHITYKE